jgi:hypothetical protein
MFVYFVGMNWIFMMVELDLMVIELDFIVIELFFLAIEWDSMDISSAVSGI